jgi:guanylate kinase
MTLKGLLVVISAPSGGGKTTLCHNLMAADARLTRALTCTTRSPRPGELEGSDYFFLTPDDFERRVAAGEFLEHAVVHGRRYGTLRREVLDRLGAGRDVLLAIDVQGAGVIREQTRLDADLAAGLVTVFYVPGSPETLEERLCGRGTEDEETRRRRLVAARGEVARWTEFDYLVVSGSMNDDVDRLREILAAERMRTHRQAAPWRL